MSSAGNNFLSGLTQIADTILSQTGAIVRMRAESAARAAQGEIGLLNAGFLSKLQAVDPATGQYVIKPEQYESAFEEHKRQLETFADERVDFAPAREAVRGFATAGLPELYVRGSMEMNKQVLSQVKTDKMKEYEYIGLNPLFSLQEKRDKRMEMIDSMRGGPFGEAFEELRAPAENEYRVGAAQEILASLPIDDALEKVNDPAWVKENNLTVSQGTAIAASLQNRGNIADNLSVNRLEEKLKSSPQEYIQMSDADTFAVPGATAFGKAKLRSVVDSHNAELLEISYQDKIFRSLRESDAYDRLARLRDQLVADKKGYDELGQAGEELAVGVKEDDARQRLIAKLNTMLAPDAEGRKAYEDEKALTMYKGISSEYDALQTGTAKPGDKAKFLAHVKVAMWTASNKGYVDAYNTMYTKTLTELPQHQKGSEVTIDQLGKLLGGITYYQEHPVDYGNVITGAWDIVLNDEDGTKLAKYIEDARTEAFKRKELQDTAFDASEKGVIEYGKTRRKTGAAQSSLLRDVDNEKRFMAVEVKAFQTNYPDIKAVGFRPWSDGINLMLGDDGKSYIFDYESGKQELHEFDPKTGKMGPVIESLPDKNKKLEKKQADKKVELNMAIANFRRGGTEDLMNGLNAKTYSITDIPEDIRMQIDVKYAGGRDIYSVVK